MYALPARLTARSGPQVTGMSCPDCDGVLEVEAQGQKGHLHFRCRVGHAYSLPSLLAAKEQVLENRLWTVVMAMEELATFLRELEEQAARECWPAVDEPCRTRQQALESHARTLRALIAADKPIDLGVEEPASGQPEPGTLG